MDYYFASSHYLNPCNPVIDKIMLSKFNISELLSDINIPNDEMFFKLWKWIKCIHLYNT